MRPPLKVVVALVVAVALASCGNVSEPQASPPPTGSPAADIDLVFKMQDFGGFTMFGSSLPFPLAVYSDGRLIYELWDAETAAKEKALPEVRLRRLTPAGVQRVLQGAIDAGLTTTTDYSEPGAMDVRSTRFTVVNQGKVHTVRVDGADFGPALQGDPATAIRAKLVGFRKQLKDLDSWLGAEMSPATPYASSAMAVLSMPTGDYELPEGFSAPKDWPFEDLAMVSRCQVITGEKLGQVVKVAAEANAYGAWRSNAKLYFLEFRPLLPDEKDCQPLPIQ